MNYIKYHKENYRINSSNHTKNGGIENGRKMATSDNNFRFY